jgi:ribosome biogenesis GTPase A
MEVILINLLRTVESSDILLIITDARYPIFHFPPSLYKYIVEDCKKPIIIILNKSDLVPKESIQSWVDWFSKKYEGIKVIPFVSSVIKKIESLKERYDQMKKNNSILSIWKECQNISKNINLKSEYFDELFLNDFDEFLKMYTEKKSNYDCISLGVIGHPNVGKSSVINSILGKIVVSTSSSPGHTKHLQHIFVSQHVRLIDCPGLVFPSLNMPKELQILCGLYPIAQCREIYTPIVYLAERFDLIDFLNLKLTKYYKKWSGWAILDSYGDRKQYLIKRNSNIDFHRAGIEILKFVIMGKIPFIFSPPSDELNNLKLIDNNDAIEFIKKKNEKNEFEFDDIENDDIEENDQIKENDQIQNYEIQNDQIKNKE